jgi:hypothetical protein
VTALALVSQTSAIRSYKLESALAQLTSMVANQDNYADFNLTTNRTIDYNEEPPVPQVENLSDIGMNMTKA